MEDFFFGVLGLLLCSSPFALLGGIVYLANRSGSASTRRLDELEWQLGQLKQSHEALLERVGKLDAKRARAGSTAAVLALRAEAAAPAARKAEEPAVLADASERIDASPAVPDAAAAEIPAPPTGVAAAEAAGAAAAGAAMAAAAGGATPQTASEPVAMGAAASPRAPVAEAAVSAAPEASAVASASASGAAEPPSGAGSSGAPPAPEGDGGGLEQLVGVRGAAIVAAVALVAAGLYFFQYSIEHGLIGPELRVALGFLVGMACVVASERPLRALAPALSPWLAGAGIAILYSASWASSALYHLVPTGVAGLAMVAVTAAATVLAVRRESLPIAILGLVGGFATPVALSTGEDHPIPLFTYLLLLDGAILYVAHRRSWPLLGLLALGATLLYQLGWLGVRMSDDTVPIGVGITLVFAALFAFAPLARGDDEPGRALPLATRALGTVVPSLLVLTFVLRHDITFRGWPTVVLVLATATFALVVARRESMATLATVAAALAAGITFAFVTRAWGRDGDFWPLVALLVLVPLLFHGAAELSAFEPRAHRLASGGVVLGALLTLAVVTRAHPAWPYALLGVGAVALVLGLRQSAVVPRTSFPLLLGLAAPLTTFAIEHAFFGPRASPSGSFLLACHVLPSVLFTAAAIAARPATRPLLDHGTMLTACVSLLTLPGLDPGLEWPSKALVVVLLFVLALLPTGRTTHVGFGLAALGCAAMVASVLAAEGDPGLPDLRLAFLFLLVVLGTAWPFAAARVGASPWGWRVAALAGPALFLALRRTWLDVLGDDALGALPIALGALVLVTAVGARRRTVGDPATQRVATVWLAAVVTGFATLAIPLQLENEWLTIGWALEAAALLALDARLRHPGLRYFAFALFLAVAIRLSPIPYLLEYHPRSAWRIVNWLSYTYLVPAGAFLAGSLLLARHEVESRPAFELPTLGEWAKRPIQAGVLFGGVVGIVFVWLNLTIIDWYSTSPVLTIPTDLVPARGLTISGAWAAYALLLLGLGLWRKSTPLRVTSLLLMLATIAKVFLHDLSNLQDLYRVAALVLLALSLIAVSFFYQRFVFSRRGAS